jgi:hypothetical protein
MHFKRHQPLVISALIAATLCAPAVATSSPLCSASEDELVARFFASASSLPRVRDATVPPLVRWSQREDLIGIFLDRSARPPEDPIARNLAIHNAIGRLGLGKAFRLGLTFDSPAVDIQLIFVRRATSDLVFKKLPPGAFVSPETDRCRVYVEVADSDLPIRSISRSHIVADQDVAVADLPVCIANALLHSIGLARWNFERDPFSPARWYPEAHIFVDVLYALPKRPDLALLRKQLAETKSLTCG